MFFKKFSLRICEGKHFFPFSKKTYLPLKNDRFTVFRKYFLFLSALASQNRFCDKSFFSDSDGFPQKHACCKTFLKMQSSLKTMFLQLVSPHEKYIFFEVIVGKDGIALVKRMLIDSLQVIRIDFIVGMVVLPRLSGSILELSRAGSGFGSSKPGGLESFVSSHSLIYFEAFTSGIGLREEQTGRARILCFVSFSDLF